jgi:hypothetical protein
MKGRWRKEWCEERQVLGEKKRARVRKKAVAQPDERLRDGGMFRRTYM